MPVEDRSRFTSAFGKRDIDNGPRDHWGVDFGGPSPGESVFAKAAADGVVEWIKTIPLRSGPAIGIRHADGSLTAYLHTRRHKVKPGQRVQRGEVIAETWHTGIPLSNGIHLHFERWTDYRDHRSVINPINWLAANGWVIRDGRLYDDWDGRATATPDINHAATTPKEEDIMTPAQEAKLDRALFLIDSLPKNVWGHEFAHPRTGASTPARAFLASDYANGQAVHAMTTAIAEKSGIDHTEVERIIRDAIEKGLAAGVELEASLNVKGK